jgi:putative transposase
MSDPNPETRDSGDVKTDRSVIPKRAGEAGQRSAQMPRKGRSNEEIVHALHQVEGGEKVTEVCRRLGVSEQTFYRWKKQFTGLGLQELRELRSLRHENSKLKRVVADLTLDRHILQEIVRKKL